MLAQVSRVVFGVEWGAKKCDAVHSFAREAQPKQGQNSA